jgi:hypothetical protein
VSGGDDDSNELPITGGFGYWVSDEQLIAFAKLSPLERLRWLDEARRFTLLAETPETRERRERLRRGKTIV